MDRLFSTLDSLPSTKLGGTRFLFGNISAAMEPDKAGPTAWLNPPPVNPLIGPSLWPLRSTARFLPGPPWPAPANQQLW